MPNLSALYLFGTYLQVPRDPSAGKAVCCARLRQTGHERRQKQPGTSRCGRDAAETEAPTEQMRALLSSEINLLTADVLEVLRHRKPNPLLVVLL